MKRKSSGHRTAIFVATAASLAVLGLAFAVSGTAAAPVAWVDVSGTPLAAAPSAHAQRSCRAADLQISAGRAGAFQGAASQELILTNLAPDACALAGPLEGEAVLDGGGRRALTTTASAAHRLDLAAGQTARMLVGTPGICAGAGHPNVASNLQLAFDTGETAAVAGVWINVECGSPSTLLFAADALPLAPVAASQLTARLSAPASAFRGRTLVYTVTLTNPSGSAISLSSCPSYTEWLASSPSALVKRTLRLNCAGAPSIAPGQSVAFEMRLWVPRTLAPGATKLGWNLEVPAGAAAGAGIDLS
jgi:hypothetical protein